MYKKIKRGTMSKRKILLIAQNVRGVFTMEANPSKR
jgi:hypothetical protein